MTPVEHDRPAKAAAPPPPSRRRHRLTLAAWLVTLGLAIEMVSLLWSHPTAFLLFLAPGALLVVGGVLLFLWEIVRYPVEIG